MSRHYDDSPFVSDTPQPRDRRSKDAGLSLTEILVVLAIILAVGGIAIPLLWEALQTVRGLMALVSAVTIH